VAGAERAVVLMVITALNHLKYDRGLLNWISCDNGSEFSGGMMDQ
jgi:hypothetical protein